MRRYVRLRQTVERDAGVRVSATLLNFDIESSLI
jgi:hypothetical protein